MTEGQFKNILERRIDAIRSTLASKAKEYAKTDRLYNFKRAATIQQITPQQALWGMFMKHFVSICDLVEGAIKPTEFLINEKIGDAINYLVLLEAVLKDKHAKNYVYCGECSTADAPPK